MTVYAACRVPVHSGPAAWSTILPGQAAPDLLSEAVTADFAVVGGGFAGLSAARRLTQLNPGARIVVLEAGRLAEGAAGRNSGFMIDLPHDLSSDDYAGRGAASDREIIALNRAASEMLDAAAMYALTGSRYYLSGLFTPGTVMIQPAGYIRSLGRGLRENGVRICENAPVTKIRRTGPDWVVTTPKGQVSAGQVILANNGHLESFGFARQRLMHIFLYASMTVDLDAAAVRQLGGASRWGVTPSDPMGTTLRRIDTAQGGNRIITRTCASFRPGMEASPAALERATRVHHKKFSDRFPALAGVRTEYSWAGHLCLSRNGVSVMGKLDDGLYAACCQNGLGTVRGTLTGMGAAELASGQASAITRHFGKQGAPSKLPPPPFAEIGANAYLRWKEWRAGKE